MTECDELRDPRPRDPQSHEVNRDLAGKNNQDVLNGEAKNKSASWRILHNDSLIEVQMSTCATWTRLALALATTRAFPF